MHFTVTRAVGICAATIASLLSSVAVSHAQEAVSNAMFVTVTSPITSDAYQRIQSQIKAQIERRVDTIVFDFNPGGKPASSTDFGPCFELADFISKLKGQTTIAFVHSSVTGHSVLPVLACKEVVMRDQGGVIGPIVTEGVPSLDLGVRQAAYKGMVSPERWPIVQKMFDSGVMLRYGPAAGAGGIVFIDARDPNAKDRIAGELQTVKSAQDGQLGSYPADVARKIELAKGLADTPKDVAELYGLPPLRPDPLQGRPPVAFQWTLKGDVDSAMRESVTRVIRDVRKKKGNVLILVMNCGGTDLDTARGLAEDLAKAQTGDDAVQIIAFIPESASDAAAIVALGCSEIVMTKPKAGVEGDVKEATFGNFERYLKTEKNAAAIDAQRKSLRAFAEERGFPGILIDGMLDRNLEIVRARGVGGNRNKTKLMTRADLDAEKSEAEKNARPVEWEQDKVIKQPKMPFQLNATLAAELGLTRFTVPSKDVKDVSVVYGVGDVKDPEPGWVDRFAEFIRYPAVTIILVMVGFIGLILELKVPGLTVPGIVAALCFILVFWAQSRYDTIFVLAILLFVLGLVLLALEIFVLPGFGVCGISGIVLMLVGLAAVSLEKVPNTEGEVFSLALRLAYFFLALLGAIAAAFTVARFLPQVPGANRLLLAPPTDQPNASQSALPGAVEAAELLGAIGTSTTPLRPAGVVRFGDKFVDVVSDGGFIPAGTRVQVIAVEGTRIVVKEV
jgi:membrane-bound ClpP family serine protease